MVFSEVATRHSSKSSKQHTSSCKLKSSQKIDETNTKQSAIFTWSNIITPPFGHVVQLRPYQDHNRHVVQLRPYQYHNRISIMSSSETPSRSKPALFNANLFSTPSSTSSSGLSSLGFGEDIFSGKYYINNSLTTTVCQLILTREHTIVY